VAFELDTANIGIDVLGNELRYCRNENVNL